MSANKSIPDYSGSETAAAIAHAHLSAASPAVGAVRCPNQD